MDELPQFFESKVMAFDSFDNCRPNDLAKKIAMVMF